MDLTHETETAADRMFVDAAGTFERDIEEYVAFDAGYQLAEGECFQIQNFPMSQELIDVCRQPLSAERLDQAELQFLSVKAVVGYDFSDNNRRLYFQNFDSRRVIVPGRRFAVWSTADASTFRELDRPVVLLDAQLAAVWDNGTLKFKSFHLAKQIFDLSAYFMEATNPQLEEFAGHARISCQDTAHFIAVCNPWSRKKIALILRDRILDDYTLARIRRAARAVRYQLAMDGDRIVLPVAKPQLRALLQFLDEDIYRGPISRRRLLSSGHRVY
jgi:hypothetical protein